MRGVIPTTETKRSGNWKEMTPQKVMQGTINLMNFSRKMIDRLVGHSDIEIQHFGLEVRHSDWSFYLLICNFK